MKFDEWWEKYERPCALKFKTKSDVQAGWYAALEYGTQKTPTDKQSTPCRCVTPSPVAKSCADCGGHFDELSEI